jgi:hypothetical protein
MKNMPKFAPIIMGGIVVAFTLFFTVSVCHSIFQEENELNFVENKHQNYKQTYALNVLLTVFLSVLFNSRRVLKIGMI